MILFINTKCIIPSMIKCFVFVFLWVMLRFLSATISQRAKKGGSGIFLCFLSAQRARNSSLSKWEKRGGWQRGKQGQGQVEKRAGVIDRQPYGAQEIKIKWRERSGRHILSFLWCQLESINEVFWQPQIQKTRLEMVSKHSGDTAYLWSLQNEWPYPQAHDRNKGRKW